MAKTTVAVGDQDLTFDVSLTEYNKYINAMMPGDKVNPAFNLLSRTVADEDKDAFKASVMVDGVVNGLTVLSIVGLVTADVGVNVELSIKKQKPSPSA